MASQSPFHFLNQNQNYFKLTKPVAFPHHKEADTRTTPNTATYEIMVRRLVCILAHWNVMVDIKKIGKINEVTVTIKKSCFSIKKLKIRATNIKEIILAMIPIIIEPRPMNGITTRIIVDITYINDK